MSHNEGEDALREAAAEWFAHMQGPDAERARPAFETWRHADPAHDAAYRGIEQSWRDSALISLTSTGRDRSLDRIRAPLHGLSQWQKIAAGFLMLGLALGLCLIAVRALVSPAQSKFANTIGSPRTLRLADGSTVTLDTDSAITANLEGSKRSIRVLRGRIRFNVAHDPAHPFVVDTGIGEVVARGTLFDVDLTHPQLQVTLYRGSIDVTFNARDGRVSTTRRLLPGQRIVQADRYDTSALSEARQSDALWVSGMLSFDRAKLADVVAAANRYSPHHIDVDASVADLRMTGTFAVGDNMAIAHALGATFGLAIQKKEDGDWHLGPA